jgi:hypothetical protein
MPFNDLNDFNPNDISDEFWNIVKEASDDRKILKKLLLKKDRTSVYKFAGEFTEAATQLNDSPFLEYLGELSEDEIDRIKLDRLFLLLDR